MMIPPDSPGKKQTCLEFAAPSWRSQGSRLSSANSFQSNGFPRSPWYEPLPPVKGSELSALVLKMVYGGLIVGL